MRSSSQRGVGSRIEFVECQPALREVLTQGRGSRVRPTPATAHAPAVPPAGGTSLLDECAHPETGCGVLEFVHEFGTAPDGRLFRTYRGGLDLPCR